MATPANQQACAFLLGRLCGEVSRLRTVSYPGQGTGPRKWLNFVQGLLDTASGYLVAAQEVGQPASAASDLVKDAEQLGDDCYQLVNFVAGADSSQIPRQVVAPFQRWVDALGITQTIFFRAEHLPNYELRWIDLRRLALIDGATKSLVDAAASINWPVLRVSVPGHAMGLLPHFAVVGHELGHAIQDSIAPDLSGHHKNIADFLLRTQRRLLADGITFKQEDAIPFGSRIVIHPHQFILAQTLEYIRLPSDVMAYVVGRSTWGRLGLIVATAVGIHPCFAGSLTLELRNLGETPLTLYPGQTIAQLFFHSVIDEHGTPGSQLAANAQYAGAVDMVPRLLSSANTHRKLQALIDRFNNLANV